MRERRRKWRPLFCRRLTRGINFPALFRFLLCRPPGFLCGGDSGSSGGAQGTLPCWLGCVFRRALGSSRASFRSGTGAICYGVNQSGSCTNGYDLNGNLLAKTDARGITVGYTYDPLNRLLLKSSKSAGGLNEAFAYDSSSAGNFTGSNTIGRLVEHANPSGSTSTQFSYDSMGRVVLQGNTLPNGCCDQTANEITAKYDLSGNLTDLTYPDGHHVVQSWGGAGRLSASRLSDISGVAASQSYLQSVLYNPDGTPNVLTLGNGVRQTIAKNNRVQIQTLTVDSPLPPFNAQPFLSHTYCYVNCASGGTANNGNIWQIADTLKPANTQDFSYDSLNRIRSFSLGGSLREQYSIDSFGNLSPIIGGVATFDLIAAIEGTICRAPHPSHPMTLLAIRPATRIVMVHSHN